MPNLSSTKSKMREAVESTLEQIAFSIVQEVNDLSEKQCVAMVETFISCSYGANEMITVCFSVEKSFLESVVSELYPNIDDELSKYEQDTIDELANTVAGSYFRLIESEIGDFQLSIPYHERPHNWANDVMFNFLLDDIHPLTVTVFEQNM